VSEILSSHGLLHRCRETLVYYVMSVRRRGMVCLTRKMQAHDESTYW
jgi:hypothetical protein